MMQNGCSAESALTWSIFLADFFWGSHWNTDFATLLLDAIVALHRSNDQSLAVSDVKRKGFD